jgi:hypothetical protein
LRHLRLFAAKLFMKPDDFESRLQRQPQRQIPPTWRAEILATAREAQAACHPSPVTCHPKPSWPSSIVHFLSSLLWPHPKAWAGLAAVWLLIFAVNISMRDASPRLAEKSVPPSAEMVAELKKQQRMFAELVGPREEPVADWSKTYKSRPRTECVEVLVT